MGGKNIFATVWQFSVVSGQPIKGFKATKRLAAQRSAAFYPRSWRGIISTGSEALFLDWVISGVGIDTSMVVVCSDLVRNQIRSAGKMPICRVPGSVISDSEEKS